MTADAGIPVSRDLAVRLIPAADAALAKTRQRTEMSDADIANRALTLYEFIDREMAAGAALLLRRSDGSTHLVMLL